MDYNTYIYHLYIQYYYQQLVQQQLVQQQVQNFTPLENTNSPRTKKTQLSIVSENDKLIFKKILTCIRGMKCTNIHCSDYHHPKIDLDIMNSEYNVQK